MTDPYWSGRVTPHISRALLIMLRDRIVNRVANRWHGKSQQPIHDNTMYAMFDRRLAYISTSGKGSAEHRALLTEMGRALACSVHAGDAAPISEETSRFVAEITA